MKGVLKIYSNGQQVCVNTDYNDVFNSIQEIRKFYKITNLYWPLDCKIKFEFTGGITKNDLLLQFEPHEKNK